MANSCRRCGAVVDRSGANALSCRACMFIPQPRIAPPGRVRNGNLKPLRIDGGFACLDCLTLMPPSVCAGRKIRPTLRCAACHAHRRDALKGPRQAACRAVARAIAAGELKRPSEFSCVDCGKAAAQYDHRDYTKPLQVEPVCRSCNVMRGPADVWPKAA